MGLYHPTGRFFSLLFAEKQEFNTEYKTKLLDKTEMEMEMEKNKTFTVLHD